MVIVLLGVIGLVFLFVKMSKKIKLLKRSLEKYQPIIDLDKAVEERKGKITTLDHEIKLHQFTKERIREEIAALQQQLDSVEEKDELTAFAFFDKVYDFETAVEYDQALKTNREKQKEMIKSEEAVKGEYTLTLNGSASEGKKIVKSNVKVMVRAFNGECDACVASVKWNNLETMQNRISRAYEQLNKIAEKMNCEITPAFLKIKLAELKIRQEYLNQKQVEKEERAELRAQMREEEQARREIEKAERDAEKETDKFSALLVKAQAEALEKTGAQLDSMEAKIAHLKEQLAEAQAKKERALSMAQQTKAGHVYVISNIGSFGENVYKVGMTRRIVPEDRVKELSDASVPFNFDIHAMIYTEDAVALEKAMHQHLWDARVNRVNTAREFFAVNWAEIEGAVKKVHGAKVHLTQIAKAVEYRQTLAMQDAEKNEQNVS